MKQSHADTVWLFYRLDEWQRHQISQERWRFTWDKQAGDKEAINRPTEAEAIAIIFLKERGVYGH